MQQGDNTFLCAFRVGSARLCRCLNAYTTAVKQIQWVIVARLIKCKTNSSELLCRILFIWRYFVLLKEIITHLATSPPTRWMFIQVECYFIFQTLGRRQMQNVTQTCAEPWCQPGWYRAFFMLENTIRLFKGSLLARCVNAQTGSMAVKARS